MEQSSLAERADRLKERIYVTFTALAVVIAIASHGEASSGEALTTMLITVVGTLLAVFVADVLSGMIVHERLLTRAEFRRVLGVTVGSIGAVFVPVVFLVVGVVGLWSDEGAIRAALVALVVGLVVSALLAVRKANLRWWQRLVALVGLGAVGLLVLLLETFAHG
jgi:hypothetical protein